MPTVLLRMVNSPEFRPELVETLRLSALAGAHLSEAQVSMLMEKMPANHFMSAYGLSEIAPVSMPIYGDTAAHITQTVGKPLEGIDVKIQNPDTHELCPAGTAGEILVQGHGLMCSYYKVPPEEQPFDDEGYLHTGDLGFLDDEGYLHFAGRIKELIIRGGENIIPNEVAAAISEHESIADVKVIGVPDEVLGEAVAAAVILKDEYVSDEAGVREFLSTRLARFKIPAYFFVY